MSKKTKNCGGITAKTTTEHGRPQKVRRWLKKLFASDESLLALRTMHFCLPWNRCSPQEQQPSRRSQASSSSLQVLSSSGQQCWQRWESATIANKYRAKCWLSNTFVSLLTCREKLRFDGTQGFAKQTQDTNGRLQVLITPFKILSGAFDCLLRLQVWFPRFKKARWGSTEETWRSVVKDSSTPETSKRGLFWIFPKQSGTKVDQVWQSFVSKI